MNNLEPDELEGLNRIEIGIGLRLFLKERTKKLVIIFLLNHPNTYTNSFKLLF